MKQGVLQIGLAGLGTVGGGVYEAILKNASLIQARTGFLLSIEQVAVRNRAKAALIVGDSVKITTRWQDIVENPDIDIIVELIGGVTEAKELILASLRVGKPVVTGNKAVLAMHGPEIFALSKKMGVSLYFEAAVAGGVPIIESLRGSLVANNFLSLVGIINGTSNYILERMTTAGLDYSIALAEAQSLGYAEADPALDVNGGDAAHKALLLALLAYGTPIAHEQLYVSGIEDVRTVDIKFAEKLGYVVKLLAVIRRHAEDVIEMRVQPSFIPQEHILSSVNGVFNAIAVTGDIVGDTLFYGRGAGKYPTASAVVSDIVLAVKDKYSAEQHTGFIPYCKETRLMPIEETVTPYYVRFVVSDKTGVIAAIATVLAKHIIGISGTNSMPRKNSQDQDLVFVLHACQFGCLQLALSEIVKLQGVSDSPVVFRIEQLTQK